MNARAEVSKVIFPFHGGVHPPEHKDESSQTPIAAMPVPRQLVVPLHQSIGNIAKALVAVGDTVLKGQMIAEADGTVSAAVHAPTSGRVVAVGPTLVPHPSGLPEHCVTIESDGEDRWIERNRFDWRNAEGRIIRDYLRDMGVVGLGGAVFPSHLKIGGARDGLDTLVINAAECEPYITCDDLLMRERAAQVVEGIKIVQHLLQARQVLVGIEDNKPQAAQAMREALKNAAINFPADVVVVPTLYPSGGAKQLIKLLTNIEVPSGVRSTDLGVQCFNVATIYTIYRALEHAEPVISRVVTITGNVQRPGNVDALIGTPIADLLAFAGDKPGSQAYIYGGPMMGFELPGTSLGLSKAGNCIIAKNGALFPEKPVEMPCIRCGKCADACPAELQPMDLYWFGKSKNFGKAQERNLFDCIECGACAYVCPSNIQLVDYFRFSKSEIWAAEKAKKAADQARERHEFRQFREEREKREKAERAAAKAAARTEASGGNVAEAADAERAAKIKAAMERAAAKKVEAAAAQTASDSVTPIDPDAVSVPMGQAAIAPTSNEAPQAVESAAPALDPEKAERIRAAMEKRAAEKAAAEAMSPEEKAAKEAEKKAKIAAAMERAAAKKAGQAAQQQPGE
ncbi:electron transport complex subunit RsxC [Amantichitinum ursilacus]|uniref:Ion-translocating oxidoreductase complex subunit C n=1 Tax=Amantichitinum ursilacus TaxID=857265 RepID=A0A0N0XLL5_9NEIS|nr:electron transport complex subunit RsxC [Amantichitinum ursilacus]KPC53417.1 Electron transport complex protein RnfC [Amantichitinum ursilacus]